MLPILPSYGDSYHPSSHWATALEKKSNDWQAHQPLPAALAEVLDEWTVVEWTYGVLQADYPDLTREHLARCFADQAADFPQAAAMVTAARQFRQAAEAIRLRAAVLPAGERDALSKEDLLHLYRLLTGCHLADLPDMFRSTEGQPQIENHKAASPQALPVLLEVALDWFTTDSFAELHPVERAALFHLRLLDLQPFATDNNRLVRLATSFYLLRAQLPPLVLLPEDWLVYQETVGYAFQMITQPGVELFSRLLVRTYEQWESLLVNAGSESTP